MITCIADPKPCSINAPCHECGNFDGFEQTVTQCQCCGKQDFVTRITRFCFDCMKKRPTFDIQPGKITMTEPGKTTVFEPGCKITITRYPVPDATASFGGDSAPTARANDALESGVWG